MSDEARRGIVRNASLKFGTVSLATTLFAAALLLVSVVPVGLAPAMAANSLPDGEVGVTYPQTTATPTIVTSETSGSPGTMLGVSGTSFAAYERDITVSYNGTTQVSSIAANDAGAWNADFVVPASAAGIYTVAAVGPTSGTVSANFTVTARLAISQENGAAGTSVTATGVGFSGNETGIAVNYDGAAVAANITADPQGGWTTTFTIPASTHGAHTINAGGSTTTFIRGKTFFIAPTITVNQGRGVPGSSIAVVGSGFSASETGVTLTYDTTTVASAIQADARGGWSTSIIIPTSPGGPHTIRAYGMTTPAGAAADLTFTVSAGIATSQNSGVPGSLITVTGSGFAASEADIAVNYDNVTAASGVRANSQGGWSATFPIPDSPTGSHTIRSYGAITSTGPEVTFTATTNVVVSQATGVPGSLLAVGGSGFAANEKGITITYDSTTVASNFTATAQGSWYTVFRIPDSPAGPHAIHARGATTPAAATSDIIFTATRGVTVSGTSGAPGSSITVTGRGFPASEAGVTLTYDGTALASGINTNDLGSWSTILVIPSSPPGPHTIHAYSPNTNSAVMFTTTPGITVSRTSGAPGSPVTVTGTGFGARETDITVTYDSTAAASGLQADAQGSWNTILVIPPSPSGAHTIGAYGAVTPASNVSTAAYESTVSVTLNLDNGYVGSSVEIRALGFAVNSPLKLTYDDKDIAGQGAAANATGSFIKTFTVPKSKSGVHTLRITDTQNNDAKATFNMDATAPPIPAPSSPDNGAGVGLLGGTTPTFRWAKVADPSSVTYQLQIGTSANFSRPILDKVDIPFDHYALMASEALPLGEYHWRVRAIDGASNQSAWSSPRVLKSGLMPLWKLLTIILASLAGIGAGAGAYFFLLPRIALRREAAVPAGGAPRAVSTGERGPVEAPSKEPAREPPPPPRPAPPEATKGTRTPSSGEPSRLKVILDFARSLPLVEPGGVVNWPLQLLESHRRTEASTPIYQQVFKGDLQIRYEPAWIHHPTYPDLISLLEGLPMLRDLNGFVDAINRGISEATSLLQEIYGDCVAEIPAGRLEKGGHAFVAAVYSDVMGGLLGESPRDPSEHDYSIKPRPDGEGGTLWLYGEEATSFAGPLIQTGDEKEAAKLQELHLKLRRNFRNNGKAKEVVSMVKQLEGQRSRLLHIFGQFDQLNH